MALLRRVAVKIFGGLLALLPAPIWACDCAVSQVQYCQKAPDPSNRQEAVFVGTVREFFPKSREQMDQLHDQFYRSHPELFSQSGNRSSRRIVGAPPDDQEPRREFIRFLWGDSLSAVEQEQLRNADRPALDSLMFDYRRRARLQVLENFSNAESLEFELFTNLDGPSCGFDFIEGETYLVEAYRNAWDQRWMVGSCTPPRLLSTVTDELNALRAWKAGHPPAIRIFGNVFSPDGRKGPAGIRLQLLGGAQALETISDSHGEFQFENLAAGIYQLMGGAAAPRARSIDLTRAWCARVPVPLDRR
jgi:hypothetical protein